MQIIDLSHTFKPEMPVFPGTEPPVFEQGNTIALHGFAEKKITFFSHTGTHLDAPSHILAGQAGLDRLSVDHFIGKAICINLPAVGIKTIGCRHLRPYLHIIAQVRFVLLSTGWSRHWGDDQYFNDFPVLSAAAAGLLCQFNLKGVGFDTISADRLASRTLPIHRILLNKMVIIENLTNLDKIPDGVFHFSALPLKIQNGDGSPVRAVAICKVPLLALNEG